jgi:FG-GAP repeat protein
MRRSRVGSLLCGLILLGTTAFADSDRPAYAGASGCDVGVESDFNNDGRSDTVVADPYATVDGHAEAGQIVVLFGDADGLVGQGSRGVIYQGLGNIGGIAESGDHFGASIAVADIDCDGFTDVVVGTPKEDINGQSDSGYAQVIFGSVGGLSMGKASRNLTQTNFGLPITAGDQFGYAVDALEDVGQGGTPASSAYAIAIGAPGANVDGRNDAGLVAFLAALDGGNVPTFTTQNSPGIPGAAEAGDRFGAAVSLNYLSGVDDFVDCAVGAPNEDVGSVTSAGAVTIVQDIYDVAEAGIGLDQNAAGVPGGAEAGDLFGRSLDTVRVGGTSRLAVGAPGEDVGSDANAGVVQLFSSDGVDLDPGSALSQDTTGVSDSAQPGDVFGDKVAWAAPGLGDTATRLAVSATKEDGAANETGMVQVFPMNSLGSESTYTQNTAGIPGVAAAADHFGSALAVVEGATERVLLVGVPDDTANTTGMVDVIPFAGGTPRFWKPGTGGVPAGGASRFGDALASVTG